jgi:hypothetical protein
MGVRFDRMRQGLLVLATLVVAACDSSTTPAVVVSLSGPPTVQGFDTTISGVASYGCHYLLTATAAGGGTHDYATWGSGHYTFTRQDGATFSGDLQNASNLFEGQLVLAPGATTSATQSNFWTLPFQFSEVLYYSRPNGPTHADSAIYSYSCQ